MISNQKAQSFGRMVLAVPALMLSEFVLVSQKVIKLRQSSQPLLKGQEAKRLAACYWGPHDHRLLGGVGSGGIQSQTFSKS